MRGERAKPYSGACASILHCFSATTAGGGAGAIRKVHHRWSGRLGLGSGRQTVGLGVGQSGWRGLSVRAFAPVTMTPPGDRMQLRLDDVTQRLSEVVEGL